MVGRFQPLHNGHVGLVRRAVEECVDVTLVLGSPTARQDLRNPFTADERKAMLAAVFPGLRVVAVPDVNNPPRWVGLVTEAVGPFGRAYGNDDATLDLFEQARVEVVRPGLVQRERYEGRAIRALLAEGDPEWRKCVPREVASLLDQWQAQKRLLVLDRAA